MAQSLTIGTSAIRDVNGLYSLNDLHLESGGEQKHRPKYFLALDQTKGLLDEIQKGGITPFQKVLGCKGGTYACKELVIAYAAWISAAFHLKVIRVFLNSQQPAAQAVTVLPRKKVTTRDDLTFTKRDEAGRLLNWNVPHAPKEQWSDYAAAGRACFTEVVELARHNPKEAIDAIQFALVAQDFNHGGSGFKGGWGYECGFANALAIAAVNWISKEKQYE